MSEHKRRVMLSIVALAFVVIGSVGMDQVTKVVAESNLKLWSHDTDLRQYRGQRQLVGQFGQWSEPGSLEATPYVAFSFNYVRNQGAAWGVLSDVRDSIRIPFFYVVTLAAVIMILMYIRSTPLHHRLARYALTLVLSGAIGNLLDRVRLGYVIDFIDVRWILPIPGTDSAWRYSFPNFNWADSCITVGVSLLLFDMLVLEALRRKRLTTSVEGQESLA